MPPSAAMIPGTTASAQESQNQGRSTRPGRTGCGSSQSAVALGGITGPRQRPSRAASSRVASAAAAMPLGRAASSAGPWPV